jgi:MFS family permease
MYNQLKNMDVKKGNFLMLFTNADRFKRYLKSILIGLPTWFVIGILITFSNDFGREFGIKEKIDPGRALMYAYAAISVGDVLVGFVSHWLKSRKKALYLFYIITAVFMLLFFTTLYNGSATAMYIICAGLGFGTGFWAIFVTIGAEQFGTNLRATAATTVPNMVRGTLAIFILPLFKWMRSLTDYITGGWITGLIIMVIGTLAVIFIKETFHQDLDFIEE